MKHVSLDLETWGTRAGCAVRSIGAVLFDGNGDALGPDFYMNIDNYKDPPALHRDPSTVAWWAQQSPEAQMAFGNPLPVDLATVASLFNRWYQALGAQWVWSHGACFDIPVWECAIHTVGRKVPWKYWQVRDTRTLFDLAGFDLKCLPFAGTAHNALDDAKHQARGVQLAYQRLVTPQVIVESPPLVSEGV